MKKHVLGGLVCLWFGCVLGPARAAEPHPDSTGWDELFAPDLSNADNPDNVWTVSNGVLTASRDAALWTTLDYDNFTLDLEFKNGPAANSGVIVYCSDTANWIPNSVEIQIFDDSADNTGGNPEYGHCGAIYGHAAPATSRVKAPGEWNRMTITCVGQMIQVALNGENVTSMDMSLWTSSETNPDGLTIPAWLSTPLADLPTKGKIGLQGKHGDADIWFRNIRIRDAGRLASPSGFGVKRVE